MSLKWPGILLIITLLGISAFAKNAPFYDRLKNAQIKSDNSNVKNCPSPVINLIKTKNQRTLIIGQTSFTSRIDRKKTVFKQKKTSLYSCDEKIIIKHQKDQISKTTLVFNCGKKDKKLERKLVEVLKTKAKEVYFTRSDSKLKDKLSCAYSIQ